VTKARVTAWTARCGAEQGVGETGEAAVVVAVVSEAVAVMGTPRKWVGAIMVMVCSVGCWQLDSVKLPVRVISRIDVEKRLLCLTV
jgi:hypothetical protein